MIIYRVIEKRVKDCTEYSVISQEQNINSRTPVVTILKTFNSLDEAERYCSSLLQTPCGEEDPTI